MKASNNTNVDIFFEGIIVSCLNISTHSYLAHRFQLQERKIILARELITDDNGFVKTLSKTDGEYLFS